MANEPYSPAWLIAEAKAVGLDLSPGQAERLAGLAEALLFWSERMALIGPGAKARLWEDHLAESLALARRLPEADLSADLGAGAGLPGLVLACLWPERRLDLFEARAKKVSFLATAATQLGLDRVRVFNLRVPQAAPAHLQGAYDLVVSRAAAPLAKLIEPAGWLLKSSGRLAALKGPRLEAELAEIKKDLSAWGWRMERVDSWSLYGRQARLIILFKVNKSAK